MAQENIVIENARIIFRNFSGNASRYNPAGNRNFAVFLDGELPDILAKDGWNVKWLEARDDEDERQAYLQVAVSFNAYPPKILMITGQGKTLLTEDMVHVLDWAEIETVDLIIRPYNWTVNDKSGVKAYVKSMYVTIVEDEFESKYYDIPFSGTSEPDVIDEDYHLIDE